MLVDLFLDLLRRLFDTEKFKYYVGEEEPEYKPTKKKVNYDPAYYQ